MSYVNKENLNAVLDGVATKVNTALGKKQNSTDIGLATQSKTVTGAINELNATTDKMYKDMVDKYDIIGVKRNLSQTSPTLERYVVKNGVTSVPDLVALVGIDNQVVRNDFDFIRPWSEIKPTTDSKGNVFAQIPKFYFREYVKDGYEYTEISMKKLDGFRVHDAFKNPYTNIDKEYTYIARYLAATDSNNTKLESKTDTSFTINLSRIVGRVRAKATDNSYFLFDIKHLNLIQNLFKVEFATTNSQSIFRGAVDFTWSGTIVKANATSLNQVIIDRGYATAYVKVGRTMSIGTTDYGEQIARKTWVTNIEHINATDTRITFNDNALTLPLDTHSVYFREFRNGMTDQFNKPSVNVYANDGKSPFSYRWVENFYGTGTLIDGLNIRDRVSYVSDKYLDYSDIYTEPYRPLNYTNASDNGYIFELGLDENNPCVRIPTVTTGASSTTKFCDHYWQSPTGDRLMTNGGNWNTSSTCGLWIAYCDIGLSSAAFYISLRLSK